MAESPSDYHRGEMEISEQQSTFHLVMGLTKWGSLATAALLVWITMWFCTDAGFLGASAAAVILTIAGAVLLREGKKASH